MNSGVISQQTENPRHFKNRLIYLAMLSDEAVKRYWESAENATSQTQRWFSAQSSCWREMMRWWEQLHIPFKGIFLNKTDAKYGQK